MREPIRDKGRLEHMLNAIDRVLDYRVNEDGSLIHRLILF